jgi:hypothetical protein
VCRELDQERGPLRGALAFRADLAAHDSNQVFDHGEPEADAAMMSCGGRVGASSMGKIVPSFRTARIPTSRPTTVDRVAAHSSFRA